ncbi:thiamine ABC transporter permease [Salmonella enterica subsp. enterica serovar Choleraesuis]|nr:thiamine ABC transporter permease [Salmonella enterica subsp. enterica serovar Choleraesuis]
MNRPATLIAGLLLCAIYIPLGPATQSLVAAVFSPQGWGGLLGDMQFSQALQASLVSTLISWGGALFIACLVIAGLWQTPRWTVIYRRLPFLLAIPHVAFASGLLLIFSQGGWLSQIWASWQPDADPLGIGLGLTLAIKESAFVLWVLGAALSRSQIHEAFILGRSLGYSRWRCFTRLILPQLRSELLWLSATLVAWSLFVVDVAMVTGPGNPPTLSVLAWVWMNQPSPEARLQGLQACLILMALFVAIMSLLWLLLRHTGGAPSPDNSHHKLMLPAGWIGSILVNISGYLCLLVLILTAITRTRFTGEGIPLIVSFEAWQDLSLTPLFNSLTLGLLVASAGMAVVICWLLAGGRGLWLLWLPLLLPAQPLILGQHRVLSWFGGSHSLLAVGWSHLLWAVPYMAFIVAPAWRKRDRRQETIGLSLGCPLWRVQLCLMLPQLARPLLAAFAVGFSVSIAQYLPGLFIGAGRVPTLTSEAVALSSGGDERLLAVHSLLQLALPLLTFSLCALAGIALSRRRRGLH